MKMLTQNKGILVTILIFVLGIFIYNIFFKPIEIPVSDEFSSTSIGDNILEIFNELQEVSLDQSLFSSPGYLLLTDFSTSVPPQAVGRSNPFDIIGRE